jgi:hypothetical protein
MDDSETLSHTTWECKYHVVFIPKYRRTYIPHFARTISWGFICCRSSDLGRPRHEGCH